LTEINTATRLQYQKGRQQNSYNRRIELQFEIECPRCYDTMVLCSDFDGLYYFCEQCAFLLHTTKEEQSCPEYGKGTKRERRLEENP
ncbi:MAG: hypothetical protein WAK17_14140, partial [Candidatus Nitrosopolaris sp.]